MPKSLTIKYGGEYITDYIDVLEGFSFPLMSPVENYTKKTNFVSGSTWYGNSKEAKIIEIPYQITRDVQNKKDKLTRVINKKKLQKLEFSTLPGRYFEAIIDGETATDEGLQLAKGTLHFLVPDGVSYAEDVKFYNVTKNTETGVFEAEVDNQGTDDAYLDYYIHHNHDNGFIGIVSEYGIIQLGKVEEVDGEYVKADQVLLNTTDFTKWPDDKGTNLQNPENKTNGALAQRVHEKQNVLYLKEGGTGEKWHGGMKTIEIPADLNGQKGSKNWYSYFNSVIETGVLGQTGAITVAYIDDKNKCICSYNIRKNDASGNTAYVDLYIGGNNPRVFKKIQFIPSIYDNNPLNWPRGHTDVIKLNETIKFYWNGGYFSIDVPELKDSICTKIQVYIAQWGNRDVTGVKGSREYITHNYLRTLIFKKVGVDKWVDIPNRYMDGSDVYIDGKETKIYVNGKPQQQDEIKGSTYFRVPPGKTKIQFHFSSFSKPEPNIIIGLREVYA